VKLRPFILSGASLLLLSAPALSQSISVTSYRNGSTHTVQVSDEDLQNTPSWNPEKEDVAPLSLRKAIEIARANLKRFVTKGTNTWDVLKVELHQMGKDKWLYEVDFYCFLAKCGDDSDGYTIYVKMDGKIVEPEIVPDNKQR
jgi:hypothetical protein